MDFDEAFSELTAIWPIKGSEGEARAAFDFLVNDTYEDPNAQFESIKSQTQHDAKGKSGWSGKSLGSYLIRKHGIRIATPGVRQSAPMTSSPAAAPVTPANLKGFDDIWNTRPVRASHRPEKLKNAQLAWVGAVARFGEPTVTAACKAWIETEGHYEHPRNLTTFLNDEDLQDYADHAKRLPSEQDSADFEEAYSLYPGFKTADPNQVRSRRDHYTAVIPKDDRFVFLAAVATYARANNDTDDQYIQKWANFVAGTWKDVDIKRTLHRSLAVALAEETDGALNVVDYGPASESSPPQMVRGWVSDFNKYLSNARKRYEDWQPSGDESGDERPERPRGDVTVDVERVLVRARANLSKGL